MIEVEHRDEEVYARDSGWFSGASQEGGQGWSHGVGPYLVTLRRGVQGVRHHVGRDGPVGTEELWADVEKLDVLTAVVEIIDHAVDVLDPRPARLVGRAARKDAEQ